MPSSMPRQMIIILIFTGSTSSPVTIENVKNYNFGGYGNKMMIIIIMFYYLSSYLYTVSPLK